MNSVTVNKHQLREIIVGNKEEHKRDFNEAIEGYRKMVTKDLEEHINRVQSGSLKRIAINYPTPSNHCDDYDRIIRMIDMHQGENIEISQGDFARYVQDDWDWKDQFGTVAASYTSNAKFDKYR